MKIKLEDLKVQSFITSLNSKGRTINGGIDAEPTDDGTTDDADRTKYPKCITGLNTLYTNRTIQTKCKPDGCNC